MFFLCLLLEEENFKYLTIALKEKKLQMAEKP